MGRKRRGPLGWRKAWEEHHHPGYPGVAEPGLQLAGVRSGPPTPPPHPVRGEGELHRRPIPCAG